MGSLAMRVWLHPASLGRITSVLCQRGRLHPTPGFAEQHPLGVEALDLSPVSFLAANLRKVAGACSLFFSP